MTAPPSSGCSHTSFMLKRALVLSLPAGKSSSTTNRTKTGDTQDWSNIGFTKSRGERRMTNLLKGSATVIEMHEKFYQHQLRLRSFNIVRPQIVVQFHYGGIARYGRFDHHAFGLHTQFHISFDHGQYHRCCFRASNLLLGRLCNRGVSLLSR